MAENAPHLPGLDGQHFPWFPGLQCCSLCCSKPGAPLLLPGWGCPSLSPGYGRVKAQDPELTAPLPALVLHQQSNSLLEGLEKTETETRGDTGTAPGRETPVARRG